MSISTDWQLQKFLPYSHHNDCVFDRFKIHLMNEIKLIGHLNEVSYFQLNIALIRYNISYWFGVFYSHLYLASKLALTTIRHSPIWQYQMSISNIFAINDRIRQFHWYIILSLLRKNNEKCVTFWRTKKKKNLEWRQQFANYYWLNSKQPKTTRAYMIFFF